MSDAPPSRYEPSVMPVDRDAWMQQLHLSNFVNAYYQFRDLQRFDPCRRVLPVVDGGKLTGIVSIGDLVKNRLDEKALEANVLLDISRLHAQPH